jgi:hypothetical protein
MHFESSHMTFLPAVKTKLRGVIEVDSTTQDFFQVVEERKRLSARTDLSEPERKRLDKSLKVIANATSYGIFAEMNRQESEENTRVTCYGIDSKPFTEWRIPTFAENTAHRNPKAVFFCVQVFGVGS